MKRHDTQRGATVLVAMIIISAVILILALNMGMSSIIQNQINLYQTQGNELSFNMNGCAYEALTRLNRDNSYTGETIEVDDSECVVSITGTGASRTVDITATLNNYTKTSQINVTIWPIFTINSWDV